jgi:hypothetical protein
MSQNMNPTHTQDLDEPMEQDVQDSDDRRSGSVETWQDIAAQYRVEHRGQDSLLAAVEDLLLDLGEALGDRAVLEAMAGQQALARRTRRFERHVHELYRAAETDQQAQMAATALDLGAPQWLVEGEDGAAWRREITALTDYAAWACAGQGEDDGSEEPRGVLGRLD